MCHARVSALTGGKVWGGFVWGGCMGSAEGAIGGKTDRKEVGKARIKVDR